MPQEQSISNYPDTYNLQKGNPLIRAVLELGKSFDLLKAAGVISAVSDITGLPLRKPILIGGRENEFGAGLAVIYQGREGVHQKYLERFLRGFWVANVKLPEVLDHGFSNQFRIQISRLSLSDDQSNLPNQAHIIFDGERRILMSRGDIAGLHNFSDRPQANRRKVARTLKSLLGE